MKKKLCYVRQYNQVTGGHAAQVMGYRCYISNGSVKVDSIVYKNDTFNKWHVVDIGTGLSYGSGKTRVAAVENALDNFPVVLGILNSAYYREESETWTELLNNMEV